MRMKEENKREDENEDKTKLLLFYNGDIFSLTLNEDMDENEMDDSKYVCKKG